MKTDISYGIVPLRQREGEWEVLLVQHHAGHWSFPKGHPEGEETPHQTAVRELKEETGLTTQRFLSPDPLIEQYMFTFQGQLISKSVHYFLALVQGEIALQEIEINASRWLSFSEALQLISFKEGQRICTQAHAFVIHSTHH